jgi:hypothetical protein
LPFTRPSTNCKLATKVEEITKDNYTGVLILDLDNKGIPENLSEAQIILLLTSDQYVIAVWRGPSSSTLYKSIKFMIYNPNGIENHKNCFLSAEKYFFDKYGITIDPSGKNINRGTFLSYDPELHVNENYRAFDEPYLVQPRTPVRYLVSKTPDISTPNIVKPLEQYEIDFLDKLDHICALLINGIEHKDWVSIAYCLTHCYGDSKFEDRAFNAFALIGKEKANYNENAVIKTWTSAKTTNDG